MTEKGARISPASGKLGVLIPGMGAVATLGWNIMNRHLLKVYVVSCPLRVGKDCCL